MNLDDNDRAAMPEDQLKALVSNLQRSKLPNFLQNQINALSSEVNRLLSNRPNFDSYNTRLLSLIEQAENLARDLPTLNNPNQGSDDTCSQASSLSENNDPQRRDSGTSSNNSDDESESEIDIPEPEIFDLHTMAEREGQLRTLAAGLRNVYPSLHTEANNLAMDIGILDSQTPDLTSYNTRLLSLIEQAENLARDLPTLNNPNQDSDDTCSQASSQPVNTNFQRRNRDGIGNLFAAHDERRTQLLAMHEQEEQLRALVSNLQRQNQPSLQEKVNAISSAVNNLTSIRRDLTSYYNTRLLSLVTRAESLAEQQNQMPLSTGRSGNNNDNQEEQLLITFVRTLPSVNIPYSLQDRAEAISVRFTRLQLMERNSPSYRRDLLSLEEEAKILAKELGLGTSSQAARPPVNNRFQREGICGSSNNNDDDQDAAILAQLTARFENEDRLEAQLTNLVLNLRNINIPHSLQDEANQIALDEAQLRSLRAGHSFYESALLSLIARAETLTTEVNSLSNPNQGRGGASSQAARPAFGSRGALHDRGANLLHEEAPSSAQAANQPENNDFQRYATMTTLAMASVFVACAAFLFHFFTQQK